MTRKPYRHWLLLPLALALLQATPSHAAEVGTLVLEEEIRSRGDHDWHVLLGGAVDFSNPHLNVFGTQLELFRSARPWLDFGVRGTRFFGTRTSVSLQQEEALERRGFSVDVHEPGFSLAGLASVRPLYGRLNFFGSSNHRFDLQFTAGSGALWSASRPEWMLTWGIHPWLEITGRTSVRLGFRQEIDRPFQQARLVRSMGEIMLGVSF